MGELVDMPVPHELSKEQREYWERQLVNAERVVAYAKHILSIVAVERSLDDKA